LRVLPFQQKCDPYPQENEWPDKTGLEVNNLGVREQKHDPSYEEERGGNATVKGTIPKPVGNTADSRGQQYCAR